MESGSSLEIELTKEKDKVKSMWRMTCEQLSSYDKEIGAKYVENTKLTKLKARLSAGGETSAASSSASPGRRPNYTFIQPTYHCDHHGPSKLHSQLGSSF